MKTLFAKMVRAAFVLALVAGWQGRAAAAEAPDRVILFIIDGLAGGAPDRIAMPAYNALREQGVYYEAMHLPLPGHPEKGPDYPWGCSLPNPMLMSGTPFIGMQGIRESLVQYSFAPDEVAFVANARGYLDVSGGFGTYVSKPGNPDSLVIDLTIEEMQKKDFAFMRVHFQRPGVEGMKVGWEKNAHEPYYRDIWHETSRYRQAVEVADAQLGRFVQWLKDQELWEGTVLMICGDHGQGDEGWHEPYSPKANVTPLLVVGGGVPAPATYAYCEIFDIAPTVTHLLGRATPRLSHGRVLHEALDADRDAPELKRSAQRLNTVLLEAHALDEAQQGQLAEQGFLTLDDLGKWHQTPAGADLEAFTLRQEALLKGVMQAAE